MRLFGKGPLPVGSQAPDFELENQRGETVRLSERVARGPVVLFFYPRDNTPVCTQEACSFRDHYGSIRQRGADVLGVSADSVGSHGAFASKHQLEYELLSDPRGEARKAFQVQATLGVLPGRVTFVIDRTGTIRSVTENQLSARAHIDQALEALEALS